MASLIVVSGQGPFDAVTGATVGTTIQEQTGQCLRNIEAILEAGGSDITAGRERHLPPQGPLRSRRDERRVGALVVAEA